MTVPSINTNSKEQADFVFQWLAEANAQVSLQWRTQGLGAVFEAFFSGNPTQQTSPPNGVWVAHYTDGSGATPFATELEALRHAVGTSMNATLVRWGHDIFTGRAE